MTTAFQPWLQELRWSEASEVSRGPLKLTTRTPPDPAIGRPGRHSVSLRGGRAFRPPLSALQQLYDSTGQTFLAEDDRQVGLASHLLQDLELLQLHQRRAGLEDLGRVGLHAHG